jgi:hypothetical protein
VLCSANSISVKFLHRIFQLFQRPQRAVVAEQAPAVVLPVTAPGASAEWPLSHEAAEATTASLSIPPDFIAIKGIAISSNPNDIPHHETLRLTQNQNREPSRALGCLRRRAAGSGVGGSAGTWSATDPSGPGNSGLAIFAELEIERFIAGVINLEHRNGAEHDVRFDPATGRVIKLTQPGEFGAWGGLVEYLQRLAWCNELFADDWLVEGWLQYPNESGPRLVTSQPWYRVNPACPEPSLQEIDAYMWQVGFLKAYEGAWIHKRREIVASDALPKNFVLDVAGYVHPIDLILLEPDANQWERLHNMAANQEQPQT